MRALIEAITKKVGIGRGIGIIAVAAAETEAGITGTTHASTTPLAVTTTPQLHPTTAPPDPAKQKKKKTQWLNCVASVTSAKPQNAKRLKTCSGKRRSTARPDGRPPTAAGIPANLGSGR